jgi:hypothetical protein
VSGGSHSRALRAAAAYHSPAPYTRDSRVLELNETLAKKVRISAKDITNGIKRKDAIVPVFEQPILRFPKLAPSV